MMTRSSARWGAWLLTWTVWLLVPSLAWSLEVPELTGRIVDRAGALSPEAEARIAAKLERHEQQTGQQFAALIVPSLEGDALEDFSIRVVERWKLGREGKDDGLLLLVVTRDRKVRIEVGYGLEGDVTDATSSRIIREVITPAFRAGDYARGVESGFDALIRAAGGVAADRASGAAPPPRKLSSEAQRWASRLSTLLMLAFFAVPLLLPLLLGRGRRSGRRSRGGGIWYIGPGGFGGGGGWSSGGGSGGGFSGGGGDFGGGGASDSW